MKSHLSLGIATNRVMAHGYQRILLGLCVSLCVSCNTLPNAANANPDALVVRGRQLALIVCSDCHVVAPDQQFSPTIDVSAPAFEEVANRHTRTQRSLEHFIGKTHWDGQTMPMTMPAPGLTGQETVAVARYIMSLRKPQKE